MVVKFINYDGEWPNLCSGNLTLEINNEVVKFGYGEGCNYERFWYSGGCCTFDSDWNEHVSSGPWEFNKESLPEIYKEFADEIFEAFSENVPEGCCGGCI